MFIFELMNSPLDTVKHQGQRKLLIDRLAGMGISDQKVLDAMLQVPRHWFMDSGLESHAYDNKAFPIAADQTISHPYTVAFQSELLEVKRGDQVLEIGTGSGYQGIVVTAGAPSVPKPLLQQLDVGGRLVIPIGTEEQIMTRFTRISKKEFNKETFGAFRFVPMLKDKN